MNRLRQVTSLRPRHRRGFTLVELLAAMTILTVMVLLISRIFSDSSKIWKLGAKRVQSNNDGRAVVDFLIGELSAAMCDDRDGPLGLQIDSTHLNAYGMDSDAIFFISGAQTAERRSASQHYRQCEMIAYDLKATNIQGKARYRLMRYGVERSDAASFDCYQPNGYPKNGLPTGYGGWNPQVLCDNVRTVEFWVYGTNSSGGMAPIPNFNSRVNGRPQMIEVYLELLGEDDAVKASLMSGSAQTTFCDQNVKRYVGRAYLQSNGQRQ